MLPRPDSPTGSGTDARHGVTRPLGPRRARARRHLTPPPLAPPLEMAAAAAALPRLGALLLPFLAVAACLDVPSHGNAPTNNPVMTHLSEANDGPAVLS